jgi:nucleoside-diphosphate-sugar epimerase
VSNSTTTGAQVRLDGATVLVTGANGFVGGRVAARLIEAGAHVRAIVRRPDEALHGLADVDVEVVGGDFTDPSDLRPAVDGADAVVHCAATAGDDLDAVRHVNTVGTRTVVDALLDGGPSRLVHISTASVYDRQGDEVDEDTPLVTEGAPYSVTKREAEDEVRRGASGGLAATILRPPAVLGWSPTSTWGERFPSMLRDGGLPFTPHPDTTHVWVHVDDLADAVVAALTDDRAAGGTYDVIGGNGTWRAYVDRILTFVDTDDDPFAGEAAPPWTGRFTSTRLQEELGWEPRRSFEDGMREAEAAFRDGRAG